MGIRASGEGIVSHVLDTCALLDLATGKWRNDLAIWELQNAACPVILSVSVWEMARKLRLGKLSLPCSQQDLWDFVQLLCQQYVLSVQALDGETCHWAERLPAIHEDPFDRMILAMAVRSNVPVFTTDRRFAEYPVKVITPV